MGALEPAEAGAPATPANGAVKGCTEMGQESRNPFSRIRNPHAGASGERRRNVS